MELGQDQDSDRRCRISRASPAYRPLCRTFPWRRRFRCDCRRKWCPAAWSTPYAVPSDSKTPTWPAPEDPKKKNPTRDQHRSNHIQSDFYRPGRLRARIGRWWGADVRSTPSLVWLYSAWPTGSTSIRRGGRRRRWAIEHLRSAAWSCNRKRKRRAPCPGLSSSIQTRCPVQRFKNQSIRFQKKMSCVAAWWTCGNWLEIRFHWSEWLRGWKSWQRWRCSYWRGETTGGWIRGNASQLLGSDEVSSSSWTGWISWRVVFADAELLLQRLPHQWLFISSIGTENCDGALIYTEQSNNQTIERRDMNISEVVIVRSYRLMLIPR